MIDSKGKYHAFQAALLFSLGDFRIVSGAGAAGNIAANGGLLASDTVPILGADAAETQQITWAATSVIILGAQTALPPDFDGSEAATIEMELASGTTDLASFTCETGWNGGTLVSTAVTDPAKSATVHTVTAVIPASSIPDNARYLTVELTPAAHGTDAIVMKSFRILYFRKTQS